MTFTFTKDVSAGLTHDAVKVRNLATGADVSVSDMGYDAATNIATFRFAGQLPDGNYRATLLSSEIKDTEGNHLDGNGDGAAGDDYSFDFFFQPGDVNHDGKVNFGDLLILAQHYGSTATFAEGDLNYDHSVGFADLLILAQNYGRALTSASTTALPGQTHQWRRYRIPGVVSEMARRS